MMLGSCSSARFLKEDEQLLTKNKVHLKQTGKSKEDYAYQLTTLYKQRPNSKLSVFRVSDSTSKPKALIPSMLFSVFKRFTLE
ncbi:MAG: hypothetical protein R2795_25015 [Saprospiraceae bacterium]